MKYGYPTRHDWTSGRSCDPPEDDEPTYDEQMEAYEDAMEMKMEQEWEEEGDETL